PCPFNPSPPVYAPRRARLWMYNPSVGLFQAVIAGRLRLIGKRKAIGEDVMPESITRTILERFDVPDSNYETIMMLVEMAPRFTPGLHTHSGFDSASLLVGSLTVIERGMED